MRKDSPPSAPSSLRATQRVKRLEHQTLIFLSTRRNISTDAAQTDTEVYLFCFYSQICYTISLAKDITEAKKVWSSWKQKTIVIIVIIFKVVILKSSVLVDPATPVVSGGNSK